MNKNIIPLVLSIISFLALCDVQLAGIGLYTVILFAGAFVALIWHILGGMNETFELVKRKDKVTMLSLSILAWEFLRLVYSIIRNITEEAVGFELQLAVIAIIILMMVYRKGLNITGLCMDIMLCAGVVTMGIGLAYHLTGAEILLRIVSIITDNSRWTAYLSVTAIMADIRLRSRSRDLANSSSGGVLGRYGRLFPIYIIALALAYILLVLSADWLGICILAGYYLVFPIVFLPTRSLISLAMKQLFALIFTVSNMSLLTEYSGFVKVKPALSMEASIYIDIMITVAGIVFFNYWDKVPDNTDPDRLVLRKMQDGYKIALIIFGAVLIAAVTGGRLFEPDGDMEGMIKGISLIMRPIADVSAGRKNIFIMIVTEGDVIGAVLIVVLAAMMTYKAIKRMDENRPQITSYALMSVMGLVLSVTTGVGINIVTILSFFTIMAAYGSEDVRHYNRRRFDPKLDVTKDINGGD